MIRSLSVAAAFAALSFSAALAQTPAFSETPPTTSQQPHSGDDWIAAKGDPHWFFLAGPVDAANSILRLENQNKAGQIGFSCAKDGNFQFLLFPTSFTHPVQAGSVIHAKLRVAGTTKELDLTVMAGDKVGFRSGGQAVPAILNAMAAVPDGTAGDIALDFPGFHMDIVLPSPRSLASVSANICSTWYQANMDAQTTLNKVGQAVTQGDQPKGNAGPVAPPGQPAASGPSK